jgi:hypothetical protein
MKVRQVSRDSSARALKTMSCLIGRHDSLAWSTSRLILATSVAHVADAPLWNNVKNMSGQSFTQTVREPSAG